MKPSYGRAFVIGAVVGLVLSMIAMLVVGATGGIPKLTVVGEGTSIDPSFAVPASALWIVSIVTAAACGLVLAVVTRGISRVLDPASRGASLWIIAPLGAFVAGVLTFAVLPLGVTVLGTLQDGIATVSVITLGGLVAVVGLVAGAVVVWQSYIMSRPPQPTDDPELLAEDDLATA